MKRPIPLALGGQCYELKPDFVTLAALENAFGAALLDIADLFASGEARLPALAQALAVILALPNAMHPVLGEDIVEAGTGHVLQRVQEYLLVALGIDIDQNG